MKTYLISSIVLVFLLSASEGRAQTEGEKLFRQVCAACHTIGQGKLIGPDLSGVQQRRSEGWLIPFIKSSQKVIRSGDPEAVKLFEEYKRMIMPDNHFSDNQIRSILQYIASRSGSAVQPEAPSGPPLSEATAENVQNGRDLFDGRQELSAGGAACNTCHTARMESFFSGGALARDLTDAFSRLNEAGIRAILQQPPFPAMKQAYQEKPLTAEEIYNLTAFLREVSVQPEAAGFSYTGRLFIPGIGFALLLMLFFGGLWTRIKKDSVNSD